MKASQRIGTDPTVQDHLGDLYQKTGRLKLAAGDWERALLEWNKTVAAEVDQNVVARVQKEVESAKMKLAREDSQNKYGLCIGATVAMLGSLHARRICGASGAIRRTPFC